MRCCPHGRLLREFGAVEPALLRLYLRLLHDHGEETRAGRTHRPAQIAEIRRAAGGDVELLSIFAPRHDAKLQAQRGGQPVRHLQRRWGTLGFGTICARLSGQCRQHVGFFDQPFGYHDVAQRRIDVFLQIERVQQILLGNFPVFDQQPANGRMCNGGGLVPERASAQIKVVHPRIP